MMYYLVGHHAVNVIFPFFSMPVLPNIIRVSPTKNKVRVFRNILKKKSQEVETFHVIF